MTSDFTMTPIAWLVVAIFASAVLIVALVYLFALKVRRDRKKHARRVENNQMFGPIIANPITA